MISTVVLLVLLVNVYCISSTETEQAIQESTTKISPISSASIQSPELFEDLQNSKPEEQGKHNDTLKTTKLPVKPTSEPTVKTVAQSGTKTTATNKVKTPKPGDVQPKISIPGEMHSKSLMTAKVQTTTPVPEATQNKASTRTQVQITSPGTSRKASSTSKANQDQTKASTIDAAKGNTEAPEKVTTNAPSTGNVTSKPSTSDAITTTLPDPRQTLTSTNEIIKNNSSTTEEPQIITEPQIISLTSTKPTTSSLSTQTYSTSTTQPTTATLTAIKYCLNFTQPTGVIFNSSNVPYGTEVHFECSAGYSLLKKLDLITCGEDGNWSSNLTGYCHQDCSKEHTIPHAHLNLTAMAITFTSTVLVSCDEGYQLQGDNNVTCLSGGKWSNGTACIVQNCSTDHTIPHAHLNFTGMSVTYSSSVPVSCEKGYQLHGDSNITCLSDGVWSNTTECQVKNVTLGGECLASLNQCTGPNIACQNSYCKCLFGYYNNSGYCESRPMLPKLEPSILMVDTHTIQVQWKKAEGNYTQLVFYTDPPNIDGINKTIHKKVQEKLQTISRLVPGQGYTIHIYVQWKNIESANFYHLFAYTRPLSAKAINVTSIQETSAVIQWSKPDNGSVTGYNLVLYQETVKKIISNETFASNQTQKEATNLIGGTKYFIDLYTTVPGQISDPIESIFYTRPQPLKSSDLNFNAVTDNGFQLYWNKSTSTRVDQYKVQIKPKPTEGQSEYVVPLNTTSVEFIHLQSSTEYSVQVLTSLRGKLSKTAAVCSVYTRPEAPTNIRVNFNSTTDIGLIWTNVPTEETVTLYAVRMWQYNKNTGQIEIARNVNITLSEGFYYLHNLTAGAKYCVAVLTLLVVQDTNGGEIFNPGIIESTFDMYCNYTRPYRPSEVTIINRNETSFILRLPADTDRQFDSYKVYVSGTVIGASRNEGSDTIVPVPNLIPGAHYEIDVFSSIGKDSTKQISEKFASTTGYTVPSKVVGDSLHGHATSSTILYLSWSPGVGSFTEFLLSPVCFDAYDAPLQINQTVSKSNFTNITGLSPESYCSMDIQAIAGDQKGTSTSFVLANRTYTSAPDMVAEFHVKNVSDDAAEKRLLLSWDRPLVAKGIIRRYVISIEAQGACTEQITLMCADCNSDAPITCELPDKKAPDTVCSSSTEKHDYFSQNQTSVSYNATKLKPFMVYDVSIQTYTRCKGKINRHGPIRTDEAAPTDSPQLFTEEQVSSRDITFTWKRPSTPNGIITEYQIIYVYKTVTCGAGGPLRSTTMNISGFETSYQLNKLQPFWSYNISIRAKTVKGYGPASATRNIVTLESKPGIIDTTAVSISTKAYSVFISWPIPCYPNGKLTQYDVERKNKDNATDIQLYDLETDFINITDGILPYRNYTFAVRAYTSIGPGNYTKSKTAKTHTAVPHGPKMVSGSAVSSNALNASWTPMDFSLYTGVTNFTLEAKDTVDSSIVRRCTTSGFYSTFCIVKGLDEYWTYHLKVTARTSAGWGVATFSTLPFRTGEDKPGKVQSVTMTPQKDVTKERSVSVSWNQPSARDLNGILTSYFIVYTMNGISRTISLNNETYQYEIKEGIMPGNVLIKVYAATKVGNGTVKQDTVTVDPGAVIKPDESQQRLVQPSTEQVDDDKRQFAVSLELSFLCNSANGQPKIWGVIVAQEELALDKPFIGTISEYNKRLETYDHWSTIKDKNKIPPYRATNEHWQPCNNKGTLRKRRSAVPGNDSVLQFVVGNDGQCSGVPANQYCNGRLQPGRSYKVKSFVCTDGGCTESEYSQPIKTEPDVTVPIVAGVVSGVVVVAAILIIVTLKRRNKLCFAKDVEHQATFERPESLELTKTSKFRPKSVKLSDFPTYVEGLEKDSGILYSEAYRLLKELSPSHPTTVAEIQACRPKTRYTNILPFDQSRVKLLPLDDEEGSDFINANYIPGYTSRREYIACQGPLPATKEDFWRMVWEQRVDIIVMLTKCMEKGKRKCDQYWPEAVQEPIYSGDLIINMQSESVLSDYVIRIIEVKLKDETRVVRQLAYLKWPDMGSPDETHQLLGFVKTVRQFKPHGSKKPMVVHCSAGVGRTGTFIAVDHILQHIRDHDEVDIFSIILDMRNYRCNMVQTEDQFVYIHECVRDFITMEDEEDEEDDDDGDDNHIYANTGYGENVYENTSFQKD